MFNKKAQVWIETAIYTLIGLTIIAILLATAVPQIDKMKDRSVVKQTIIALNDIDLKITEVIQAPGNIGRIDLKISRGRIEIDPLNDLITFILEDSRLKLTELGQEVEESGMKISTKKKGDRYNIFISKSYNSSINITYNKGETLKTIQAGNNPYKFYIENVGDNLPNERTHLDINVI